jgi:type I restriction enzyme M protein
VFLINGGAAVVEGKNQNTLSEANVTRLASAFHAFQDEERFARVVTHAEIEKNDWNLNIARYVQTAEDEAAIDVAAEVKQLKALLVQRNEAESKMLQFLHELGYDQKDT